MRIVLSELFQTDTLRFRETARKLLDNIRQIDPSTQIELDFTDIVFASRSFCHELLRSLNNRRNVQFIHMNSEVQMMLKVAVKRKPLFFSNSPIEIIA